MKTFLENEVRNIAYTFCRSTNLTIHQLKGGNTNFVFRVIDNDLHKKFVVRCNIPTKKYILQGYIYWNNIFNKLSIPIPKLIYSDLSCKKFLPYLILEDINGLELLSCYSSLSTYNLQSIAKSVIQIQRKIATLPQNKGFGAVLSYEDSMNFSTWEENIKDKIKNIITSDSESFFANIITETIKKLNSFNLYFKNIKAIAFFEELNYKNLLINDGKLVCVLDFDEICFGDVLLFIGKTKAGLLLNQLSTEYYKFLLEEME
ncbi:MAG: hypothetical protein JO149_06460, partial [Gammaproteobacteria bacterium]|nr:hypothetical protein [Gammaproteobacteria bacterium]